MLFSAAKQDSPIQFGAYLLTEAVGQGGMAVVYKATRQGPSGFEKTVVIKAMLPALTSRHEFVAMFSAEARIMAQLAHPNIVQVHDFGVFDGIPYLAMEYLPGRNLSQLRTAVAAIGQRVPVGAALAIARDVCHGLAYAHDFVDVDGRRRQIIHRDVSPSNVMVCRDGSVKLLDFGVAKIVGEFDCEVTQSFKGKYAYMAPEQVNRQPIDRRVDVWAAGVVLHELLTSKRLFAAASELETLRNVASLEISPPSSENREVPRLLDAIVKKALERDPAQRYASGGEMAEALETLDSLAWSRKRLAGWVKELFIRDWQVTCEVCGKPVLPATECSECGTRAGGDPSSFVSSSSSSSVSAPAPAPTKGRAPQPPPTEPQLPMVASDNTEKNVVPEQLPSLPRGQSEPLPLPPPPTAPAQVISKRARPQLSVVRTPVPGTMKAAATPLPPPLATPTTQAKMEPTVQQRRPLAPPPVSRDNQTPLPKLPGVAIPANPLPKSAMTPPQTSAPAHTGAPLLPPPAPQPRSKTTAKGGPSTPAPNTKTTGKGHTPQPPPTAKTTAKGGPATPVPPSRATTPTPRPIAPPTLPIEPATMPLPGPPRLFVVKRAGNEPVAVSGELLNESPLNAPTVPDLKSPFAAPAPDPKSFATADFAKTSLDLDSFATTSPDLARTSPDLGAFAKTPSSPFSVDDADTPRQPIAAPVTHGRVFPSPETAPGLFASSAPPPRLVAPQSSFALPVPAPALAPSVPASFAAGAHVPVSTSSFGGAHAPSFPAAFGVPAPAAALPPFGAAAALPAPTPAFGLPPFGAPAPAAALPAPTPAFGAPSFGAAAVFGGTAPAASPFGAPAHPFGSPAQAFGAPAQSFGSPAQAFGAAQPFGAPSQAFGAPPTSGLPSVPLFPSAPFARQPAYIVPSTAEVPRAPRSRGALVAVAALAIAGVAMLAIAFSMRSPVPAAMIEPPAPAPLVAPTPPPAALPAPKPAVAAAQAPRVIVRTVDATSPARAAEPPKPVTHAEAKPPARPTDRSTDHMVEDDEPRAAAKPASHHHDHASRPHPASAEPERPTTTVKEGRIVDPFASFK